MNFADVVNSIRCSNCAGEGLLGRNRATCVECGGSGINPGVVEEASGWDSWAISVHESPGWIVAVHVGLTDPTGRARSEEPWNQVAGIPESG